MSKLINEDWEHAAYANDVIHQGERDYRMQLEWQEWEQEQNNKKPATIIVEKPIKDENTRVTSVIQRTHQKRL